MGEPWIGQCKQSWLREQRLALLPRCWLARGLLDIPKITARARNQRIHPLLGSAWTGRHLGRFGHAVPERHFENTADDGLIF